VTNRPLQWLTCAVILALCPMAAAAALPIPAIQEAEAEPTDPPAEAAPETPPETPPETEEEQEPAVELTPAEEAAEQARAMSPTDLEAELARLVTSVNELNAASDAALAALKETPEDLPAKDADQAAREARDAQADTLLAVVEVAEEKGLDVTEERTLLIRVRGIDASTLDAGALTSLVEDWLQRGKTWLVDNGPGLIVRTIAFLLVLLAFKFLASIAGRLAKKALSSTKLKITDLLRHFFVGMVQKIVFVVGLLFAFRTVGVDLGPVLAGVGIIGFVVGFALQDTLGNFAAGIMILLYRPFDVGDLIEGAGTLGTVVDLTLVSTTLNTLDNQKVIVPNGAIWGGTITNVTARKTRRVDLVVGIGYGDDIEKAKAAIEDVLASQELVLADPAPDVAVHGLGESSVDLRVRPWCNTGDYWQVASDTLMLVKQRLDKEGITIPFPQRDLHMSKAE
jgi:small conductance mechanosensitive channel